MNVELLVEEQIHLMQAHTRHGLEDIPGVFQPVHVADLRTVIGRDRQLRDPQSLQDQLNDDFSVEMKVVRVSLERDLRQSLGGIDSVAGMKLGESECAESAFWKRVRIRLPIRL